MAFRDLMAADLAKLEAVNDFGTTATVTPVGGSGDFSLFLTFGDHEVAPYEDQDLGEVEETFANATCSRADYQAGVVDAGVSAARDPERGDELVIASGADAGTWYVASAAADPGDGLNLRLRRQSTRNLAHPNSIRV